MEGMSNKEVRSFSGAAAPMIKGRAVSGYAIVFNTKSEVMVDFAEGRRFREVIQPGAITEAMLRGSDIKMLLEHNKQRLLARSKFGKGTLRYQITGKGVAYNFDSPNTTDGNFAVEMLMRGDMTGSSFAFSVAKDGDKWRKDGEIWLRTITRIEQLYDFSIVSDPAYNETTADVRSRLSGTPRGNGGDWQDKLRKTAEKAGMKLPSEDNEPAGAWQENLKNLKKRL